jgi:hypothetical protein
MFASTVTQQNAFAATLARKPAHCFGYWLEATLFGTAGSNSIEQDPMQMASFYKDSSN